MGTYKHYQLVFKHSRLALIALTGPSGVPVDPSYSSDDLKPFLFSSGGVFDKSVGNKACLQLSRNFALVLNSDDSLEYPCTAENDAPEGKQWSFFQESLAQDKFCMQDPEELKAGGGCPKKILTLPGGLLSSGQCSSKW